MELRNWIGLIMIFIGIGLQPVGWIYYYPAQIASFFFILIGCFVFATQKYLDKKEETENSRYIGKRSLTGDTADNSGWGRGGQSHSYQTYNSDGGDSGGGD